MDGENEALRASSFVSAVINDATANDGLIECPFRSFGVCIAAGTLPEFRGVHGRRIRMDRRETLVMTGERRHALFAIRDGVLKLSKALADGRTQIVGFRFPGDILAPSETNGLWTVTARAVSDVTMCIMDRNVVERISDFQALEHHLIEQAHQAVLEAQDHMVTLGQKAPTERLASFILELARRQLGEEIDQVAFEIPMTRTDIGNYLGLKSETVSRLFTKFRTRGFIDLLTPRTIAVVDGVRLAHLAQGMEAAQTA